MAVVHLSLWNFYLLLLGVCVRLFVCVFVCADDKDYDVYISYSRNSEDEDFVLSTLRSGLETQLGYTVCIFDRDSLPGGSEYTNLFYLFHHLLTVYI